MMMSNPVRRTHVYLYISNPFHITYTHPCIEEIRTSIVILLSRTQYDNRLTINGGQPVAQQLMPPHIL